MIKDIIDEWQEKTVMVLGDVMLDRYIEGAETRLNPECPGAPLIRMTGTKEYIGGAGNVAQNIVALGGKAELYGVTGNDENGNHLEALCNEGSISFSRLIDNERTTSDNESINAHFR